MIKRILLSLFLAIPLLSGGQLLSTRGAGSAQGFGLFLGSSCAPNHGVVVFENTTSSTWTVPACVTKITSIEAIGPGGKTNSSGVGGGGGAYSITTNLSVVAGQIIYINTPITSGAASWANISANSAPSSTSQGVLADFGLAGSSAGTGGQASNSIGTTAYNGGNGGAAGSSSSVSGGGGGAAGPGGVGQNGGNADAALSGGGGGAAGGSAGASAGQAGQTNAGGAGGGTNGGAGANSSTPAVAGSSGGGGGGGFSVTNTGGANGAVLVISAWGSPYGPGAGAGGRGAAGAGAGTTARFGAGQGGGSTATGSAGEGIVVITY